MHARTCIHANGQIEFVVVLNSGERRDELVGGNVFTTSGGNKESMAQSDSFDDILLRQDGKLCIANCCYHLSPWGEKERPRIKGKR